MKSDLFDSKKIAKNWKKEIDELLDRAQGKDDNNFDDNILMRQLQRGSQFRGWDAIALLIGILALIGIALFAMLVNNIEPVLPLLLLDLVFLIYLTKNKIASNEICEILKVISQTGILEFNSKLLAFLKREGFDDSEKKDKIPLLKISLEKDLDATNELIKSSSVVVTVLCTLLITAIFWMLTQEMNQSNSNGIWLLAQRTNVSHNTEMNQAINYAALGMVILLTATSLVIGFLVYRFVCCVLRLFDSDKVLLSESLEILDFGDEGVEELATSGVRKLSSGLQVVQDPNFDIERFAKQNGSLKH